MTKRKTYAPHEQRFCPKCQIWQTQEGGTGAGRKYRCGSCNVGRLAPNTPVLTLGQVFAELLTATPGLTSRQLSDLCGHPMLNVQREVCRLVSSGRLFVNKTRPQHRYYATQESLEAMREEVERDLAVYLIESKERDLEKHRRFYRNSIAPKLAAARALKPPKVRKVRSDAGIIKKPKPEKPPKVLKAPKGRAIRVMQPKPIPSKHSLDAWKNAEPIVPDHVKVQVLPGYSADRWQVQAPANGFAALGIGRYAA